MQILGLIQPIFYTLDKIAYKKRADWLFLYLTQLLSVQGRHHNSFYNSFFAFSIILCGNPITSKSFIALLVLLIPSCKISLLSITSEK